MMRIRSKPALAVVILCLIGSAVCFGLAFHRSSIRFDRDPHRPFGLGIISQASQDASDSASGPSAKNRIMHLNHPSPVDMATQINTSIATTGCNLKSPLTPGATATVAMISNGQRRSFRIYVPPDFTNTSPHAVVLDFHGFETSDFFQETISGFDAVAKTNSFLVVYPNGLPNKQGQRGWDTGLHPGINANDTLFVSDVLNVLQSNLCINSSRIYATGFSNGGGFTNLLACTMSARFAAFAPVSGSYVTPAQQCQIQHPASIIEFHGTADGNNPYQGKAAKHEPSVSQWLAGWVGRDKCSSKPSVNPVENDITKYTWTNCTDGTTIVHYKIDDEHHIWPTAHFPELVNGHTESVDAANIIWHFFSQHPLNS